jgi:HD-GYP domain-containing protein (c-di-GMP phosphodiesterase class II)
MEANVSADRTTGILSFMRQVTTAISNSMLYSPEHQQVTRLCSAAHQSLKSAMGNDKELSLLLVDDELIFRQQPLQYSMYNNRFCQALKSRGIGHLRLMQATSQQDILFLIKALSSNPSDHKDIHSSDNVRFGKLEIRQSSDVNQLTPSTAKISSLADVPVEELVTFMEIYEEARQNKKINIVGITEIVSCFIDTFKKVADPIIALAPLRAMDEYTFTHSTNVCILNLAQAMSLGIEGPLLNDIGVAAMLHDIGKLYVPEEVLTKAGKLNDNEWEMIKQHPTKGAQRLLDTPGVPRLAVVTAFEHHLKYDHTGYPEVAADWQQNLCSHMTTISDIFDALRSKRSYRDSMEFSKIAGIMLDMAGTDLHPVLARNFLRIISRLSEQPMIEQLEQDPFVQDGKSPIC